MSTDPLDDPELVRIISSALEMRDEGIEPPIEQLCGERPDLVPAVREAICLVGDLPSMQERASGRDPHANKVLAGRYRLEARIGSGAMGVVYRAQDLELQRPVAVKILRASVLNAEEAGERFAREAKLLASIRHPAVITIHDRGMTDLDEAFLVTELLEGASLSDLLDEGRRRESAQEIEGTAWIAEALAAEPFAESSYLRTVVRWAADLAAGLGAAHEAGIVHRDVKPSNVIIDRSGKPVLLDFGIASSSAHATLMRSSGALGTPAYMAPEALDEELRASPALDIYGLAATLYHMLVCRAPYHGSPSQVLSSLAHREPPPAYKLRPGLPRDLQAILDKGMARRVSARYASALELESDLRAFLNYRPVSARPVSVVGRSWRRLRRSTAFWTAVVMGLSAVAVAGGAQWKKADRLQRQEEFAEVWERVPPALSLNFERPGPFPTEEERQRVEGLLTEALELLPDSIHARLVRAGLRVDHGDFRGAAADIRVVARSLGTAYSSALADSYAALVGGETSNVALDLSQVPAPDSPLDHYVAAFHILRLFDWSQARAQFVAARQHLERPELKEHQPSLELLIIVMAYQIHLEEGGLDFLSKAKGSRLLDLYARAERMEALQGRRTASSAHFIGVVLLQLKRYSEALGPIRDGVELCPESFGLNLNYGIASRRMGLSDQAQRSLRRAIEIRPNRVNPYETLVRVHLTDEDFDLAREVVETIPYKSTKKQRSRKLELQGDVEFDHAIWLRQQNDAEGARRAAARAVNFYDEQLREGASDPSKGSSERSLLPEHRICRSLVNETEELIFEDLLELMLEEPLRWLGLVTVLDWMPDDLSPRQSSKMREYLLRLKQALAQRGD